MIKANEELKIAFREARNLIEKHRNVLVVSHEYTDGDDLGGVLALGQVLKGRGQQVYLLAKGGVPDNLLFLPGQNELIEHLTPEIAADCDLLITCGCGNMSRPGFALLEKIGRAHV